jgi:predicted secreted protein
MGALINLFKNIFGGIFGFIGGLFGGKSSGGYYLEADALDASSAAPAGGTPVTLAAVSTPASAEAKPAKAATSLRSAKNDKVAKEKAKAAETTAAAPSTSSDAATLITNALNMPKVTVTEGFAEKNSIPVLTGSRRRPGPSLSMYKEMAKGMNGSRG